VTATGHGSRQPVAPNAAPDGSDDPDGRALNRRVTVTYTLR
jgi:outer membrane protein OmpA-like peptidoglycan-associated protein